MLEILNRGLIEAFEMGLNQSPFDAENSEYCKPYLELKLAPKLAAELSQLMSSNQVTDEMIEEWANKQSIDIIDFNDGCAFGAKALRDNKIKQKEDEQSKRNRM